MVLDNPERKFTSGTSGRPALRKRRRGVALLPSLFTLGNCLCGFSSLNYAAMDPRPGENVFAAHFAMAGYFIFLAMVFDMFDGFVARLTRSASDFGAALDSLADMISFGIAPAFLSIHLIAELLHTPAPTGRDYIAIPGPFSDDLWLRLFWIIAGIYVSCTALRLARFNVITKLDPLSHMTFRGMPSPAAAATVAGTVTFFESLGLDRSPDRSRHFFPFNVSENVEAQLITVLPYVLPTVLLIAALLMVSRFSYTHLINRFLRGRRTFRTLVGFFLLIMAVFWQPQISAIVGIYLYALSAPAGWLYRRVTGKPERPEGESGSMEKGRHSARGPA